MLVYFKELFYSSAGRCEHLAWCERCGETPTWRGSSSPGSHTLDSVFKELCCKDTTKGGGIGYKWTHLLIFSVFAVLFTICLFNFYFPQYAKLCNLTENEGSWAPMPDFLFELEYSDLLNTRFEKTREGRDVFYAFHGSRLENFHSIIHNGLHCHLNKVTAEDSTQHLPSRVSF